MRRTTNDQYTRQSEKIQELLGAVAREEGRASGFVQRRSKMTAEVFAQTMILGVLENPEATLNDFVQISARLGVAISEPGLHARVNGEAVDFLKRLLEIGLQRLGGQGSVPAKVLETFTRVDILDSTQFAVHPVVAEEFVGYNSPGTEATLKIQLSTDYLSGALNAVEVGPGRVPDQACDLAVQKATAGSLQLFDAGYAVLERLRRIDEKGAFFLTPLKAHAHVYLGAEDSAPVDLARWLEQQAADGGMVDRWVYVGRKERLPVRLVAYGLPQAQVDQRRRRARQNARKKGYRVRQRHLRLLAWNVLMTNLPQDRLSAHGLRTLYRVRWQIELFFKLSKSHFRLASVRRWRRERLLSQLYARLIAIVLFQWLIVPWRFSSQGELSPTKAYRIVRRQALAMALSLRAAGAALNTILAEIRRDFMRYALKSPRNKSPSTFDLLRQLDVQVA